MRNFFQTSFCIAIFCTTLSSTNAFANCKVTGQIPGYHIISCEEHDGSDLEHIYDKEGNKLPISQKLNQNLFIEEELIDLSLESELFTTSPVAKEGNKKSSLKEDKVIERHIVYREKKRSTAMRVFLTGFQYNYQNLETTFDTDPEETIRVSENKTTALPKKLSFELRFKNDVGLILSPDFTDDGLSEIALFKRFRALDIGLFSGYSRDSSTSEYTDEDGFDSTTGVTTDIYTGLFLRNETVIEDWSIISSLRLGYLLNKIETKEDILKVNGGYARLESSLYYEINNNFYLGSGLGLGVGFGTFSIKSENAELADSITAYEVILSPLQMIVAF